MDAITVYVAGPLTSGGNVAQNVRHAIDIGDELLEMGFIPFIPHLTHFWQMMHPHPYQQWMQLDMAWLEKCDCVFRLPGVSAGADNEVRWALEHGTPVFTDYVDLQSWIP